MTAAVQLRAQRRGLDPESGQCASRAAVGVRNRRKQQRPDVELVVTAAERDLSGALDDATNRTRGAAVPVPFGDGPHVRPYALSRQALESQRPRRLAVRSQNAQEDVLAPRRRPCCHRLCVGEAHDAASGIGGDERAPAWKWALGRKVAEAAVCGLT
jgi:hypothetical protein